MATTGTSATRARWTRGRDAMGKKCARRARGRAGAVRVRASAPEPPKVRRDASRDDAKPCDFVDSEGDLGPSATRGARETDDASARSGDSRAQDRASPFGFEREMDAVERQIAALPTAARLGAYGALVALGAGLGNAVGGAMPANVRGGAKVALTAVVGGGAAYGVSVADKKRFTAAPKSLWNSLQGRDPLSVTAEEVNAMGAKFGIANMGQSCATAMTELYDVYLMSLVPQGLDPVQGWEAAALAQFRQTLGIDDASAAQAHLEAGRRLFRKRIELGSTDKETDLESRKEFQKLVFISTQTFGEEQARFLLPWKRVFRVSDAQVDLALTETTRASSCARACLKESGGHRQRRRRGNRSKPRRDLQERR